MNVMDNIRLRSWSKLKFYDPATILQEFRKIEHQIAGATIDERVRALRTTRLKKHKEGREAALLCHGIGVCVLGTTVDFSPTEASDYDFVARWRTEGIEHYSPVQLKEWVPSDINPRKGLNDLLASLNKYTSSKDTIVGIYSNRAGTLILSAIVVPTLDLAGLWLFGSTTPDASKWFTYGDMLRGPQYYEFTYPA